MREHKLLKNIYYYRNQSFLNETLPNFDKPRYRLKNESTEKQYYKCFGSQINRSIRSLKTDGNCQCELQLELFNNIKTKVLALVVDTLQNLK